MKTRLFFFIVMCALLLSSCKSKKATTQVSSPYLIEETSKNEEVTSKKEEVTEETSKTEVVVRTESVKLVEPSQKAMYRYYVVIGSFSVLENARTYSGEMVRKGFEPEILHSEIGYFRVSVGGFDDEKAARSRIAGIRTSHREAHSDVWLLIRK